MIPTVIILSLEDAVERRAPLITGLETHDIPYEIWRAIDGRNGLPPEYETMIDRDAAREYLKRDMGNAEFACALSHHFIYLAVLERDLDMAVILEDDAIVDERFFRFLKTVQTPDCDLLLLDHMRALVRRSIRSTDKRRLRAVSAKHCPHAKGQPKFDSKQRIQSVLKLRSSPKRY